MLACGLVVTSLMATLVGANPAAARGGRGGGCSTPPDPSDPPRCARQAAQAAKAAKRGAKGAATGGAPGDKAAAARAPGIESGGVSPSIDNTIPLLKPGMFRLDLGSYVINHPIFGIGSPRRDGTDLVETFTLGYGVNPRLTIFAGAVEVNASHNDSGFSADFVDPKVGFLYRIATPSEFRGNTLDFVGDVTVNEPFGGVGLPGQAVGDVGPIGRARLLVTREVGHGFTLQGIGGLQAAQVTTPLSYSPFGGLGTRKTTDVDGLLGLAGQYRLTQISDRLYVNGELDYLVPLSSNVGQVSLASPFKISESYAATLGASYVLRPGSILARLTDTVTLDNAGSSISYPPQGSRRLLSNTVGITLSFLNFGPGHWLGGR